jgi:hypothetical protein
VAAAVETGDLDLATERRGREADRGAGQQGGAVALEHLVPGNVEEDVEVARRGPPGPASPLPARRMRVPVSTPAGTSTESVCGIDPALATAMAAGLFDDLAAPVAVGAGPLDHEEALLRADLAMAAAQVAAARRRAGRGAGPAARIAGLRDFDVDFGGLAMERLFQRHLHVIAQVGAAPALLAATAAAEGAAEDRFEDIADVAEIAAAKPAPPPGPPGRPAGTRHGHSDHRPRASADRRGRHRPR